MNTAKNPVPLSKTIAAAPPKFGKSLLFLILSPIILGVVSSGFIAILGTRMSFPFVLITGEAVLFFALIFFLRTDGLGFKSIGWVLKEGWRSIWLEPLLGIAAGLAIFLLIRFAVMPVAAFGQKTFGGFQFESLTAPPTIGRIIFSFLVAPFVEEFIFRGYGITGLGTRLGAGLALIITSLFFGLYHFGYGLWGMFQLTVTGFLYGLVFLWRKSLPSPIASHAVVNLLLLLLR